MPGSGAETLMKGGIGEFNCEGLNDNSFLKQFGGMNKGRPNEEDIERAAGFAEGLKSAIP